MYNALPIALAPVLGNPVNLLQAALDGASPDASIADNLAALVRGAGRLLGQLPLLAELLPPETLAWKLQLLQQGCAAVGPILGSVPQRVLLVVGDQDLLIPSKEEGKFLQKQLRRAHLRVERGRSHALLQEGGVDLVAIMQEEGALVHSRRMSARLTKRAKGSGFGSAAPIELPTEVELKRYADRTTAFGRRLASPVFLSTSPSGDVCMGLGNLPTPGNGPVLFVGNHQTLALDLGVLCEELLKEQGIMVRGLAHPVIFGNTLQTSPAPTNPQQPSSTTSGAAEGQGSLSPFDIIPTFGQLLAGNGPNIPFLPFNNGGRARREQATDGRQAFADFMVEFGAVPVSGRNMARLLQNGESVLLFPGGVREAYRRKGEEYRLFWPKRAEFVRMAAKWGATIVPFAAVGVDDSLDILLDADELRRAPILGQMVANRASKLPRARRGVTAVDEDDQEEAFVSPLAVPKFPPRRMYFLFQKPIATRKEDMEDRARVEELYAEVKGSVEGGLEYLLRRRAEDPYENFQKRVFYEAASGGRPAPTFPLH